MNQRTFLYVGMYEAREIPRGWQHPQDEHAVAVPLLPYGYNFDDDDPGETMPPPLGETEIMAYETVSEGTPISPAFPNTPEGRLDLVRYCAEHLTTLGDHKADAEAWAAILFGDAGITLDGEVRG